MCNISFEFLILSFELLLKIKNSELKTETDECDTIF